MNEETPWIWCKGIAALCDHRLPDDFPEGVHSNHEDSTARSQADYYVLLASRINEGDLVWVRTNWLPFFVSEVLPDIKQYFVLVTGDIDDSIPSDVQRNSELILDSSKLLHWFAQNHDGARSDRISPIPIGMDFHSIQQGEKWGIKQLPVTKQHEVLEMIRLKLKPTGSRKRKLYIDSQFASRHDPIRPGSVNNLTRADVYQQIHADPAVQIQPYFLPQFEMWMQRGQFDYVLSHHGFGLDCHRTWEALVLGHIVVVQKSSMDPLYENLPVIIVDDWAEVAVSGIGQLLGIDCNKTFRHEKLTNKYWVEKMRVKAKELLCMKPVSK